MVNHSRQLTTKLPLSILLVCLTFLGTAAIYFVAITLCSGGYNRKCLIVISCMMLVSTVAIFVPLRGKSFRYATIARVILCALLIQSFGAWIIPQAGLLPEWGAPSVDWMGKDAILTAVGGIVASLLLNKRRYKSAVAVIAVVALLQGLTMHYVIRYMQAPRIDTLVVLRDSDKALLQGKNPYTITFPNIYAPGGSDDSPFYSKEVQKNGRLLFGYPYPPFSLLMILPIDTLTHDPRYALVLFFAAAAVLTVSIGRGPISLCAAVMLLLAPPVWLFLRSAWTEPEMILGLAAIAWLAVRRSRALPIALGLFLSLKQYTVIFIPLIPLILPRPTDWKSSTRFFAIVFGTAAAVTLPMILWDWKAFWDLNFHIIPSQPFRRDSLSFLAMYARSLPRGSPPPSGAFALVALLPFLCLALWKAPRNAAGFVASVAIAQSLFFLFSRQSFLNYHFFSAAALLIAAATYERVYGADELSLEEHPLNEIAS